MKNKVKIAVLLLSGLATTEVSSQNNKATVTTETRKVLYYQVEEVINQSFGGKKTSYTVSDLSLISSDELGPDNIRTITPIYKKETFTEKSYADGERKTRGTVAPKTPVIITPVTVEKEIPEPKPAPKVIVATVAKPTPPVAVKKAPTPKPVLPAKPKVVIEPKKVAPIAVAPVAIPAEPVAIKRASSPVFTAVKSAEIVEEKVNRNDLSAVKKPNAVAEVKKTSKPYFTPVGKVEPIVAEIEQSNYIEEIESNSAAVEIDEAAEKAALAVLISNIKKTEAAKAVKTGEKVTSVYVNIIDTYERIADKGYKSAYVFRVIADSFYFSDKFDKAARWYTELFNMTTKLDPVYFYRYGASLKKSGNTKKGDALIEKFSSLSEE
ncbi:hypothetical protein [Flavobacterium algicola]|uniref:hypothetical protein n=1 Tax=Flavobacterium algicola TaxID=556529 RepID=UPI001EFEB3CD|nr:hypothetical protein [Flavobacterium algicola]MCG9792365.1 hypothetical protein [Flavobacterium algicola]